jgi:type III secretion system HrpE/YscL family protein
MVSKIIKASTENGGTAAGPRILKKDVFEAGLTARDILDAAAKEAQAILDDAEQRRHAIAEDARQAGFREGMAEWVRALEGARQAQDALAVKYEPQMIRLAVAIAEKIIGEELRSRPETIVSVARECLRGVQHEHSLAVRVNPQEVGSVQRSLGSLVEVSGSGRRVQVVADAAVAPGGCMVESVVGVIDARLETQLTRLREILLRIAERR